VTGVCGRFVTASPPDELARYFDAATEALLVPNYNVAPSTEVFVVVSDGSVRRLDAYRWGLVPHWAKDLKVGNKMINARAETIADKAVFRRPLARRRCIIPADGFYEWTKVPGHRKKQPWFIHRPDGEPFAFAGLWEIWRPNKDEAASSGDAGDAAAEEVVRSCTIITGPANSKMAELHDRMPVMLPPSAWDEWLDPHNDDLDALGKLLVPAPPELIAFHPVSIDVSNVRNRGSYLINEVADVDPDGKLAGDGDTAATPKRTTASSRAGRGDGAPADPEATREAAGADPADSPPARGRRGGGSQGKLL
jgi:putative SOS response-associated peptidase YedK